MGCKTVAANLALSAAMAMSLALPAMAGESVLYGFSEANGVPEARLLLKGGALYGTVTSGGSGSYGSVFELQNSGGTRQETTLFSFDGSDGQDPLAGLTAGKGGVLYGTSGTGGADQGGTVFMLKKSGKKGWTEQTIWNFATYDQQPNCDLVVDSTGAIYGTTVQGGAYGYGTVFELTQSGGVWTETASQLRPERGRGLAAFQRCSLWHNDLWRDP
ncbi:MAG TPA: choice-of-anchor tandem repeat GloVer-containing protein [Rhizomicrobium sp.]|jgi:uncharacterized repeat protein (TIGR03803 family)|nr:choice-of-anchor tandem repeat GloVer-containing protein [Rhizomicrobium sp.]